MIIGINGYAKSGKDTVGRLIQYLNSFNVGNLSPEEVINDSAHDWWLEDQSKWEIKKFAGKLKVIAYLLTGIPIEKFEDQEFKKTDLSPEWSNHGMPMTVREFLQKLGTDGLREGLHPNTWVNALMADYTHTGRYGYDENMKPIHDYPNWIITDCRFPNEAAAIKKAGGMVVRINRPGIKPINDHPSEIALDKYNFDYVIENDGDLFKLTETVKDLLCQI